MYPWKVDIIMVGNSWWLRRIGGDMHQKYNYLCCVMLCVLYHIYKHVGINAY